MEELLNAVPEETAEMVEVVDIQFRPGQKIYFFDPDGMTLAVGDHVVMDTARGAEFGICTGGNHQIAGKDVVSPLRKILRRATAQDEKVNAENRGREKRAFEICMQKIENHGLDMQLVSAECAFDGSKILFYFTADERVDFRELVKDLASVFHTRIELRQIGVRDKAKMVGGLGICGRPFCCASFLDDFQPVSIKMAKTQNLSLNPTKISGTCGRLMCCLKYEQDTYESLIRTSPKVDSFVDTPEGRGTIVESDILRQRVRVQMENDPETFHVFPNEEIAILRVGKAKKTDPPVPAELAPISGDGKRARRFQKQEAEAPLLDPIKFRYSTEKIVDDPVEQEPEEGKIGRNRRRKPNRPMEDAPVQADQPKREMRSKKEPKPAEPKKEQQPAELKKDKPNPQPKKPRPPKPPKENREPKEPKEQQPAGEEKQPTPAAEGQEGENKRRRRPNYRRYHKPKQPSGE